MRARIDLAGALALVTGAGSGIGQHTTVELARRGARVVCTDIDDESAEKTALMCREAGDSTAVSYRLDVADRTAMDQLATQIASEHGNVDVLVNNAGVGMSGRFADVSAEDWRWIRSINLDGIVNGCAVFAPGMLARGRGHVVNVSSGLAYTYTKTEPAYVATKAAVLALSRCLRADFAEHGVGVTAICPGVINTPIVDATRYLGGQADEEVRTRTKKLFRRGHQPQMVAKAIVKAVERDRSVVPVGVESWLGWWLNRYLPVRIQQALGKLRPV